MCEVKRDSLESRERQHHRYKVFAAILLKRMRDKFSIVPALFREYIIRESSEKNIILLANDLATTGENTSRKVLGNVILVAIVD